MIPFHAIYSWFFKSFRIGGETELVDNLINDGHKKIMIIKRSWIFWLFISWIPLTILILSAISIGIAYYSIEVGYIRNTIVFGNILMDIILVISSFRYIGHFRDIYGNPRINTEMETFKKNLHLGDVYFINFFNWTLTNQVILFLTIVIELTLVIIFQGQLGDHVWILTSDTVVMIIEMMLLKSYRKRMIDLEMDYNVVVPGKIFFVNQTGVLSAVQTIESDKIKTVRSSFPSKIASFFNYGTVDVLTEGDSNAMMGTMSMFFVTNPDGVVTNIQSLLDEAEKTEVVIKHDTPHTPKKDSTQGATSQIGVKEHSYDTRSKIRDVLR